MEDITVANNTPNKRRYLREPIIVFKIIEEGNQPYFFGYAKNISRGGVFIASVNPRNPGEQFHITFQIPRTNIMAKCQCEVVWTRRYNQGSKLEPGYGVRFLDLPDEVASSIEKWITVQLQEMI